MFGGYILCLSLLASLGAILLSRFYAPRRPVLLLAIISFLMTVLLSVVYWVANYFTGRGINEAVIYHLKAGMQGAGMGDYMGLVAGAAVALVVALALAVVAWRWGRQHPRPANLLAAGASIVLAAAAVLVHPAGQDLYRLQQYANINKEDIALPASYMKPTLTPSDSPSNVVVLYLESLERTYLDDAEFPGLTPNLSRWEKKSTHFTDIRQVVGSGWTIGGMVASQCGIPLMTPGHGNAMQAMPEFLPLANCLGDQLSTQGYQLDFMGGADLSFAGKGKFYHTHQFNRVDGRDELISQLDDPPTSAWGLYDDDMLRLFTLRLEERSGRDLPFGLLGLTLDTHHPEGHMPPACDGVEYADGNNPMLNAVHCSDRLVGEFLEAFAQSEAAEDTVLLVMSDHLAMRNTAWKQLEKQPRRDLVMMFAPGMEPQTIDRPGSTLDIAPTLLSAMGHDLEGWGFGRNLFSDAETLVEREGDNANAFLYRQRSTLSGLWRFPSLEEGLVVKPRKEQVIMAGQEYAVPALMTLDDEQGVTRFIPSRSGHNDLPPYLADLALDDEFIWIDKCRNVEALFSAPQPEDLVEGLCLAYGSLNGRVIPQRLGNSKLRLNHAQIAQRLNSKETVDAAKQERRQTRLKNFQRTGSWHTREVALAGWHNNAPLTLQSAAFGSGASRVRYRQQGLKNANSLRRGVSLVGISSNAQPELLAHVDTCQPAHPSMGISDRIDSRRQDYAAFAVLVHDTAFCDDRQAFNKVLSGTELEQWRYLGFRQPYIGVVSAEGQVVEITGDTGRAASLVIQHSP